MDIRDLRPVNSFARRFGVKMVIYGPPGSGKTPLIATAPNPLILLCETGAGSLRNVPDNIPGYQVSNAAQIDEFFLWWFKSAESKQFDTLAIDSISEMSSMYLEEELKRNSHGMQAYGKMADRTMKHLKDLNEQPQKHLALLAKMGWVDEIGGGTTKTPLFPGKFLTAEVPHLFDNIAYLDIANIPKVGPRRALRNHPITGIRARDRFGKLAELEQPDLSQIFSKSMA